jgi:hypothetical protein
LCTDIMGERFYFCYLSNLTLTHLPSFLPLPRFRPQGRVNAVAVCTTRTSCCRREVLSADEKLAIAACLRTPLLTCLAASSCLFLSERKKKARNLNWHFRPLHPVYFLILLLGTGSSSPWCRKVDGCSTIWVSIPMSVPPELTVFSVKIEQKRSSYAGATRWHRHLLSLDYLGNKL